MAAVTPEEMREIEDRSEKMGVSKLVLMENAGSALSREIVRRFPRLQGRTVVVVAGGGNNGGDGMVCARHLIHFGAKVSVFLLRESKSLRTPESITNWKILGGMKSITCLEYEGEGFLAQLAMALERADIIIDGIFGTGVEGGIREPESSAIDIINSSRGFKVAIDIPSGIDPVRGEVHDKAVIADLTVTFHRAKTGLRGAQRFTGELIVSPIGIPPEAEEPTLTRAEPRS